MPRVRTHFGKEREDDECSLDCGSIASCEEASEATAAEARYLLSPDGVTSAVSPLQNAFKKRGSKSRLSLSLHNKGSTPPEAASRAKSPTTPSGGGGTAGILPKFLRSSFRGLFKVRCNRINRMSGDLLPDLID